MATSQSCSFQHFRKEHHTLNIAMKSLQSLIEAQSSKYYLDSSASPFIFVTEVPLSILEDFDRIYIDKGPRVFADFSAKYLLIETMVHAPHEILGWEFGVEFGIKIRQMGLHHELAQSGATRITYGTFVKEPDVSWMLRNAEWPALALETGFSENTNQLAIEAQGWLEADGSKTQLVLTAKIHRNTPRIIFQLWERESQLITGVITRRRAREAVSMTQTIEISNKDGITQISGELKIPFRKLFCRPARTANEGDITITKQDFEDIADQVWAKQRLM